MPANLFPYKLARFFCWILLLQMINISVDPPNVKWYNKSVKAPVRAQPANHLESVYEMVAEALLHQDIPDNDNEEDLEKTLKLQELFCSQTVFTPFVPVESTLTHISFYTKKIAVQRTEPFSPPPELA